MRKYFTPGTPLFFCFSIICIYTYYRVKESRFMDDFSQALLSVKASFKIARKKWINKQEAGERQIFVVYQKGYPEGIPCNKNTAEAWYLKEGDLFKCNPYLQIQNADGSHSMWSPTSDDVLAEDWVVV